MLLLLLLWLLLLMMMVHKLLVRVRKAVDEKGMLRYNRILIVIVTMKVLGEWRHSSMLNMLRLRYQWRLFWRLMYTVTTTVVLVVLV